MIDGIPPRVRIGDGVAALHGTDRPARLADLDAEECETALRLQSVRRLDYLLGRAALKEAMRAANLLTDARPLRMPHPRLSLTHGGGIAIAARWDGGQAVGIGVDWEPARQVEAAAARFFLSNRERTVADLAAGDLLRLWTVKEALYKATPGNADLSLIMYEIEDPASIAGEASLAGRGGVCFRYVTCCLSRGFLSIAVAQDAIPKRPRAHKPRNR